MNEQQPQLKPQELRTGEPDTFVTDSAKAEVMAYASKGQEEAFIGHTTMARVYEHGALAPSRTTHRGEGYIVYRDLADEARKDADNRADIAGGAYDKNYRVKIKPLAKKISSSQ